MGSGRWEGGGGFKPVLNLASYIRYCLDVLLKTGLPRLRVIKGVQKPFLMSFDAENCETFWL